MHWILEELLQSIDLLFFWVVFIACCATKSLKHNCDSCLFLYDFHLRVLFFFFLQDIISTLA